MKEASLERCDIFWEKYFWCVNLGEVESWCTIIALTLNVEDWQRCYSTCHSFITIIIRVTKVGNQSILAEWFIGDAERYAAAVIQCGNAPFRDQLFAKSALSLYGGPQALPSISSAHYVTSFKLILVTWLWFKPVPRMLHVTCSHHHQVLFK